ncbi:fungal specific transcription factor domain-containing protein [Purpureocillium lavendulum]|uniref:Fungal specific transcription factor domain-containing protein n=1 Tax=Purpureocillium lavendulum TaxID=1247861 RepID=A0AB34FUI2_9HYPO|nr:fungal specific transcription factor domain-containing protein [Purpureocillium lavendulum]
MGFLLSCKQAYHEGIAVFYTSNTILIENQPLIDGFLRQSNLPGQPRLLSLAVQQVTALNMTWHLVLFAQEDSIDEERRDRAQFETYLELLPRAFPKLRHLTLQFGLDLYSRMHWPDNVAEEMQVVFYDPLVLMSAKLPDIAETWIALPAGMMVATLDRCGSRPVLTAQEKSTIDSWDYFGGQLWYPFMDRTEDRGRPGKGLWLKCGQIKGPYWSIRTGEFFHLGLISCFGT